MVEVEEHPMCSFDAKEDAFEIEIEEDKVRIDYWKYTKVGKGKKQRIDKDWRKKFYEENHPFKKFPDCFNDFKNLKRLKMYHVDVEKLENLDLPNLERIEASRTNISKLENLDKLPSLRELWLLDSKIKKMENLDALENLDVLYLGYNKIKKIEGLNNLKKLIRVGLENNEIKKIEGLENNTKLKGLDLDDNNISKIENLEGLEELESLSLKGNELRDFSELENARIVEWLYVGNNHFIELPRPMIDVGDQNMIFSFDKDDEGEPIGYYPRAFVHNEEALIGSFNNDNRIIVAYSDPSKRGVSKDSDSIDKWDEEWNENG